MTEQATSAGGTRHEREHTARVRAVLLRIDGLRKQIGGRTLFADATLQVREGDRKGRHTTVRRELFRIPGGALLLDTPGMRELRVGVLGEGLKEAFADIEEFAGSCRFRDCRHEGEPGCAVLEAVAQGSLDSGRLESFRKLQAEAAHELRKADPRARAAALSEWKTAIKTMKHHPKHKG